MINLGTLISSIGEKDLCEVRKANTLKKLADERDTLEKLNANKFTFKTIFKSKTAKDKTTLQLVANIAQRERDIKNWDEIKRFLVVYIAEIAIPDYKKRKMQNYLGAMQSFSKEELENAQRQQNCWKEFYDLTRAFQGV
jgi:hypothetical protein